MNLRILKYEKINKSLYRIYLSNKEVLDIYDEIILNNNLLLKKELDTYLYEKITKENNLYKHYISSIKYISIRIRSTKEMIEYLKRNKLNDEEINYVIDKLIKEKILDDNKFCMSFIKDKLKFTTMGENKIIYELKRHNISSDIIESNKYLFSEEVLIEKMSKLIEKQIKINHFFVPPF